MCAAGTAQQAGPTQPSGTCCCPGAAADTPVRGFEVPGPWAARIISTAETLQKSGAVSKTGMNCRPDETTLSRADMRCLGAVLVPQLLPSRAVCVLRHSVRWVTSQCCELKTVVDKGVLQVQKRRQHLFVAHVLGRWVPTNPPTALRGCGHCSKCSGGCTCFAALVWTMLGVPQGELHARLKPLLSKVATQPTLHVKRLKSIDNWTCALARQGVGTMYNKQHY